MILHKICVENWRCFLDPVEVGPFSGGLNVLHAPNASGKSTMFEALLRGILDGHKVQAKELEAIRPWGRSLAPSVKIELNHDGTDLRITKRFLENAKALLERNEGGRFVGLAEGTKADQMIREILTRNPPGRGLARPENWGVAQILWAPQGELAIANLSGDVLADIRHSLGAQVSGKGAERLVKRIEEVYLEYFTPGGKLKSGRSAPELARLRESHQSLVDRRAAAFSQHQTFEETARGVEDLRARRAHAKRDAESIARALIEARDRADQYRALVAEKKLREDSASAAETQHGQVKRQINSIDSVRRELQRAEESLQRLQADAPLRAREVKDRDKEAARAKALLEDVRKDRKAVDLADETAERARRFAQLHTTQADLTDLIEKIQSTERTLGERKKERTKLAVPKLEDLRAIRKATKDRDDAQLRIDASLITLEVVPDNDGSLEVLAGEEVGARGLTSGTPTQIKGSPEVVVHMPDIARLRAWGPAGSVAQHRTERESAEKRLSDLTKHFGTTDVEELELLAEKARKIDKGIAEAETQLETLLSGKVLEDIEQQLTTAGSELAGLVEQHPSWRKSPPDVKTLKATAYETRRSFIERVESAEQRWERAQGALTAAAKQSAGLTAQLRETKAGIRSQESNLAKLTDDGKEDRERKDQLRKLALSWDAARASLDKIQKQLTALGEDPPAVVDRLEKQLAAADEAATKALEKEKNKEGRLQQLSAQGTYSALASADEDLANLEQRIADEEPRVESIHLIREVVGECRAEALEAVTGPVEAAATRTLERIAGQRLGSVQFNESFEPANVLPAISDSSVALANVSGGEREQIYLATRLALAEVLAKDQRQLVVLDDVLTFTDAGRLARVMKILEEAAQRLQILILTCHPERYRGLEQAQFIDLEAVIRECAKIQGAERKGADNANEL